MKEFNLEQAKAGKPVCRRDGKKARIICYDAKSIVGNQTLNFSGRLRMSIGSTALLTLR